jgi:hypothetical protein
MSLTSIISKRCMMTTLREARESGKLKEFIKEHSADPKGDPDAFNRAVQAMARKSPATRKASPRGNPDD